MSIHDTPGFITHEYPYGPPDPNAVAYAAGLARYVKAFEVAVEERTALLPRTLAGPDILAQAVTIADYNRNRAVANALGRCTPPVRPDLISSLVIVIETTDDVPKSDERGKPVFPPSTFNDADGTFDAGGDDVLGVEAWVQMERHIASHTEPIGFTANQRAVLVYALVHAYKQAKHPWQRQEVCELSTVYGLSETQPLARTLAAGK